MQRGTLSEHLVCQGSGTAQGLLNIVFFILGHVVGYSSEDPTPFRRSGSKVSTHCSVCNRGACHSCASAKRP